MSETRYIVEVNLDGENLNYPWIEVAVGRFKYRTEACLQMLELSWDLPKFKFRVSPIAVD